MTKRINETFVHTAVTPGIAHLLQNVVVPQAHLFALSIAIGSLAAGIMLLLGLFARLGGAIEILLAIVNILVGAGAGADTVGFNTMLITAGAITIATCAGRRFGIDRMLVANSPSPGLRRLIS